MEKSSIQNDSELKIQNIAQRHSPIPIPNDWIGAILDPP
jgi:hypothetical protein